MSTYWTSLLASIFPPRSQEEAIRREHARVDHLIAEKKLRVKYLKKRVKERKKEKFIKKMEKIPAKVAMVHIDGLSKTSDQIVMSKIGNLFNVNTFEDIIKNTKDVHKNLRNLGCFEAVNIEVDTLADSAGEMYQIHITVEERGTLYGQLGLAVPPLGHNYLHGNIKLGLANLWGEGEKLEVGLERGPKRLELASLSLLHPIHSLPEGSRVTTFLRMIDTHLHHLQSDVQWVTPGASLTLCLNPYINLFTEASFSWLHSRYCFQPGPLGPCTAMWDPAMESAGHIMRLALKSQASLDTRNCRLMPRQGMLLKAEHCIMASPDVKDQLGSKVQVTTSLHWPLPYLPKVSSNCRVMLSQLWGHQVLQERPLVRTPQEPFAHVLQEPTNLLLLLSLSSPLPLLAENSVLSRCFRIQGFVSSQAGSDGVKHLSWKLFHNTLGIGFIGKVLEVGRLELNYCFPLSGTKDKPGLRFSFGAEFL